MSIASRTAKLGRLSREVRRIRNEVRPFAEQTGDRAYQFWDYEDGSRIEVRVWPGGRTKVSVVH